MTVISVPACSAQPYPGWLALGAVPKTPSELPCWHLAKKASRIMHVGGSGSVACSLPEEGLAWKGSSDYI